jgi:hypothetical protein
VLDKIKPLIIFAVLLMLLLAPLRVLPFAPVLLGFYVLGVLMSGAFVLTWFPLAFRALAHHRRDVSLMRIVDYAGLQLLIFLAFLLIIRNFVVFGIPEPQDELAGFSRVFLPVALDIIIGLRLYKWARQLWTHRHGGGDPQLLSGVSKSSDAPGMPH